MYMIRGKRGTGKTKKCFERARKQNAALLCGNPAAMKEKAKALGFNDIEILGFADLKDTPRDRKIIVDEALMLFKDYLEKAFSVCVDTMSFTEE